MIQHKKDDKAFTGLEAAIVLIAFVVVAAVFSYVVLGAGFFTTQKAQETVYTAVAQATSNIQVVGQVYGLGSADGIDTITFAIGLAPGSPTLDISKMKIVFSTPSTPPLTYTHSTGLASGTLFSANETLAGTTTPGLQSLMPQNQTHITLLVNPVVPKNTIINIEIHPSVGAALPFSKTTPPSLTSTNVLY
ncbi:MAG: flagellin [Methanoregula sp.]|nr:flagellin [Methanoregula sp.]